MAFATRPRLINLRIARQPDDISCGPTCLHSIYNWFGDDIPLSEVIRQTPMLRGGGTLAANLGYHALTRGYQATIYSYNPILFDPSWNGLEAEEMINKLERQQRLKEGSQLASSTKANIRFLRAGGLVRFDDLTPQLLLSHLSEPVPILAGLSATYLYKSKRENPVTNEYDDIKGEPAGHFVVLSGFDRERGSLQITDPYSPNPVSETHEYEVSLEHLVCSILLGVITYDANLLILRKP
ncbi:MAG: peptidase-C39 like family protein [bacterium]|nr:peptidase-C39 like family protein [bacterium]